MRPLTSPLRVSLEELDPALPDLARSLDPGAVAARFERCWPVPGSAPWVDGCTLHNVSWLPGVQCTATYRLELGHPGRAQTWSFGVVTVEPEGIEHRLFTDDPQLPGLAAAADAAVMTPWLAERLGRPVDYCSVTPVRYRPGARCVLRYTVPSDRSNGRRTHLYGKVMAGMGAELLATRLSTLGPALVAPIVGVSQVKQLVVQGDAGDGSLSSAADSGTPSEGPGAEAGAGGELLARLHSGSGPSGPCHSLAHDARELYQYLSAAERVSPVSAALLEEGIERLGALDDLARPTRPGHGSFRLGQVHLGPSGPVLIDLDSYCWSEPARDVGNLLAYLRWREIREPARAPALARVRSAFLAGYHSAAATLDEARVQAFASASLLKIAGRRYRALAVGEWPHAPALIDASLESLRAGTRRWP